MRYARELRNKQGLSLSAVKRLTGIAPSVISKFEHGASMSEANEDKYAQLLGTSVDTMRRKLPEPQEAIA